MTLNEVIEYYGKSYKKILCSFNGFPSDFIFEVDRKCGKYLELECKNQNGFYIKVNHGISNTFPYNLWYKAGMWAEMKNEHFHSQGQVYDRIIEIAKERYLINE